MLISNRVSVPIILNSNVCFKMFWVKSMTSLKKCVLSEHTKHLLERLDKFWSQPDHNTRYLYQHAFCEITVHFKYDCKCIYTYRFKLFRIHRYNL